VTYCLSYGSQEKGYRDSSRRSGWFAGVVSQANPGFKVGLAVRILGNGQAHNCRRRELFSNLWTPLGVGGAALFKGQQKGPSGSGFSRQEVEVRQSYADARPGVFALRGRLRPSHESTFTDLGGVRGAIPIVNSSASIFIGRPTIRTRNGKKTH